MPITQQQMMQMLRNQSMGSAPTGLNVAPIGSANLPPPLFGGRANRAVGGASLLGTSPGAPQPVADAPAPPRAIAMPAPTMTVGPGFNSLPMSAALAAATTRGKADGVSVNTQGEPGEAEWLRSVPQEAYGAMQQAGPGGVFVSERGPTSPYAAPMAAGGTTGGPGGGTAAGILSSALGGRNGAIPSMEEYMRGVGGNNRAEAAFNRDAAMRAYTGLIAPLLAGEGPSQSAARLGGLSLAEREVMGTGGMPGRLQREAEAHALAQRQGDYALSPQARIDAAMGAHIARNENVTPEGVRGLNTAVQGAFSPPGPVDPFVAQLERAYTGATGVPGALGADRRPASGTLQNTITNFVANLPPDLVTSNRDAIIADMNNRFGATNVETWLRSGGVFGRRDTPLRRGQTLLQGGRPGPATPPTPITPTAPSYGAIDPYMF
jgi:hypothetical protein